MAYELTLTGKIGSKFGEAGIEAFRNKRRLPGSNTSEPLDDKIVDDIEPIVDAIEPEPLTTSRPKTLRVRRDGCGVQYQCRHAYLRNSGFIKDARELVRDSNLLGFCDMRRPANHGKCICDSAGKIPKLIVHNAAMSGYNFKTGTKALVRYLAKHDDFVPKDIQSSQFKTETLTGHTYVYVPEEFLKEKMQFASERGSMHSSLIHQFGSEW